MSKLITALLGSIFVLWFINFDSEEYLDRRAPKKVVTANQSPAISQSAPGTSTSRESFTFPVKGKTLEDVISGYGDTRNQGSRTHEGIDIPADRGTPVLAVADGKIAKVAYKGNAGKQIWLEVGAWKFFYAHLDSWSVAEGQMVKKGEAIGTVGNTGNARNTLPHLHFGLYIDRGKTGDPTPLFLASETP